MAPQPLLLLEHVNYNIPSNLIAKTFYVDGLGCQFNPVGSDDRQLHVNCGASQIHLPYLYSVRQREPVTVPHVLDGHVELVTRESLQVVQDRLEKLFPQGGDKDCFVEARTLTSSIAKRLQVTCPWGNTFLVRQVKPSVADEWLAQGEHAGGSNGIVGIERVVVRCPSESLRKIFSFYKDVLDCQVSQGNGGVVVPFSALAQELVLRGEDSASKGSGKRPNDYDAEEVKRFHIAVYLQDHDTLLSTFEQARHVLYVNERFAGGPLEFSSSNTKEEADTCGQYRTKDMRPKPSKDDGDENTAVFALEHEIRSPRHKSYPLHNK